MNLYFNGDSHNHGCVAIVCAMKKILDRVDLPLSVGWGEGWMIGINASPLNLKVAEHIARFWEER